MEKRDLESSVALGNYLALAHGNYDSNDLIFKNSIEIIHLKIHYTEIINQLDLLLD
ncbi:hypothetical protein [Mesomycoplasma ovipneumoniae]|uniref:Uncharacterized protein n=1 Tax=Mesomycoplasma ovipneumoniae TaxID=29562 RepID=A0AAJ2P6G0_9BACT|nr:hypothetical protein [Mesomycoplasma ovipneumoniae]MDW2891607.1 hypothetical protein [Mesomycoplasma ovipneumoniae]MDW2891937.1 hypothetical protein [Mesomycoplasma ovipneumoniae]MDW2898299.1 hypothetical protein [Mesomycoplasma ovipneumoniae]